MRYERAFTRQCCSLLCVVVTAVRLIALLTCCSSGTAILPYCLITNKRRGDIATLTSDMAKCHEQQRQVVDALLLAGDWILIPLFTAVHRLMQGGSYTQQES